MEDEVWKQQIESRIKQLETTVNKSNFSEGLALSLENINETMDACLNNVSDNNGHIKPIVQCAAALIEKAFQVEIARLRQKG
jgi:hypothetical protein